MENLFHEAENIYRRPRGVGTGAWRASNKRSVRGSIGQGQFSTRRRVTAHIHLLLWRIVYSVRVIGRQWYVHIHTYTLRGAMRSVSLRGCVCGRAWKNVDSSMYFLSDNWESFVQSSAAAELSKLRCNEIDRCKSTFFFNFSDFCNFIMLKKNVVCLYPFLRFINRTVGWKNQKREKYFIITPL